MSPLRQNIDQAFRSQRWLWVACGVYLLALIVECQLAGVPAVEYATATLIMFYLTGALLKSLIAVFAGLMLCQAVAMHRRGGKWHDLKAQWRAYLRDERFARGISTFLIVCIILFYIGAHKSLFPHFNPFRLDPVFAAWDAWLHFGRQPYEWVTPLVEYLPFGPQAISVIYLLWFSAMYATCFHAGFVERDRKRAFRFLWSFVLSWMLLGVAAAMAFSSVGPMYYHDFYPGLPDIFKPLVDNLYPANGESKVPMTAATRALLLGWMRDGRAINFNALSAMPSLHVGLAWLFVLYWRHAVRWMFVPAAVFFVLILIGSVYLGFHYAIDGYVAMAGVTGIWMLAARLAHRDIADFDVASRAPDGDNPVMQETTVGL